MVSAQDSATCSLLSGLSVTSSIASTTRRMDAQMIQAIKSPKHAESKNTPGDLYGEFFFAKNTLDAEHGVQVGWF